MPADKVWCPFSPAVTSLPRHHRPQGLADLVTLPLVLTRLQLLLAPTPAAFGTLLPVLPTLLLPGITCCCCCCAQRSQEPCCGCPVVHTQMASSKAVSAGRSPAVSAALCCCNSHLQQLAYASHGQYIHASVCLVRPSLVCLPTCLPRLFRPQVCQHLQSSCIVKHQQSSSSHKMPVTLRCSHQTQQETSRKHAPSLLQPNQQDMQLTCRATQAAAAGRPALPECCLPLQLPSQAFPECPLHAAGPVLLQPLLGAPLRPAHC